MTLSLLKVDLLKAEESPVDSQRDLLSNISNPLGRHVSKWTKNIEVIVYRNRFVEVKHMIQVSQDDYYQYIQLMNFNRAMFCCGIR
jgi:hypothetical protein